MKWYSIAFFLFVFACTHEKKQEKQVLDATDSLMIAVKQHHDSSIRVLRWAEEKTMHAVSQVSNRMDSMYDKHAQLKNELEVHKKNALTTQKIIQRDTIYITEKKNFWGRTKRTTDSTSSTYQDTLKNQEMP